MPKYTNRKQIEGASNEDIIEFFENTIFYGIYSTEVKSKYADSFKGSISDITLDGHITNLCPKFLNVPKNSNEIEAGPCKFKVRLNIEALRNEDSKYIVNLRGYTLQKSYNEVEIIASQDSTNQELFEYWGVVDTQFIGYYHHDKELDINVIDDIRKTNFDHIPFYPGDSDKKPICISIPFDLWGLKKGNYYLFNWKLSHKNKYNPYEILLDLDKKPKKIDPKWFIDNLFDDRYNDKSKNFGSATNFLDTLSKQLSAKESTFVYELLQNANDYPVEGQLVDVEFHITDNYLLFLHSGDTFNVRNISGICGINEKEKTANKKTIGYKGIGFKTVFLNNHYVYIRTGKYSFRFDEHAAKIRRLLAPWPILPVWTEHEEVESEVNTVFDKDPKHYKVQIALRPDNKNILHTGKNSYENLFKDVFNDSNIILFIPNINSVKVFINGEEVRTCYRNNEEWIVCDYEKDINEELQALINRTIETGRSRIPEKYTDFDATKVSFACKHDGSVIKSIDDGTLYCYLPTNASWGLPFLMNTDMIPKGDRNDIETEVKLLDEDETNFNEEMAGIAGEKLFDWIYELLVSKKYHYGSVFSLIPNFERCIKEHKEYTPFIERFRGAFEEQLEDRPIVPIHKNIAKVSDVILDDTGLSSSGIMSDDEFYEFAGFDETNRLPIPMLRRNKDFRIFHKRYVDGTNVFNEDSLHKMIGNEQFQEWLKIQENNDKFLKFLLDKDYLQDFLGEAIFIEEECGKLYKAKDLYYDVDDDLTDLSAFSNHIYYLSLKTREYFKGNEEWEKVCEGAFGEFKSEKFIKDTLLSSSNLSSTVESLKDWETSSHFYNYVARKEIVDEAIKKLPFFNDDDELSPTDDFNEEFVFFSSQKGKETFEASWLSDITVAFVSSKYRENVLKYFEDYLGVRKFDDSIVIDEIILSEDFANVINEVQQQDYSNSEDFIKYCFLHKDKFESGSLKNYALSAIDKDGTTDYILSEDHIYFPSDKYDEFSTKEWIDNGWMYCLYSEYLKGYSDTVLKELKTFLYKAFGIEEIDNKNFYEDIVKGHISDIIDNTSGDNDADGSKNVDFVSYLDDNYKLIFEEEKDEELFFSIKLFTEDGFDIESDASHIYAYDEELKEIINSEWFPAGIVNMCSHRYGNSKAILKIKAEKYKFSSFFDDVITGELLAINDSIDTKEKSIAFHNLIISNKSDLTDKQKDVMKGAKLYLYGSDEACENSNGHKILSAKAKELFDKQLVEFADLDIIDPAYNPEENVDYWETRLGNSRFTVDNFTKWLDENTDTFIDTISDKDLNVSFWRWVKDNLSDSALGKLPNLPLYLMDGNTAYMKDAIYLSDAYIIDGGGIETTVKVYDNYALFVSSDYMEENDDVEKWKDFWTKVGLLSDIVDILVNTIIPRLDEINDETLPAKFVKYSTKLVEHFKDEYPKVLANLRLRAYDNNFYPLSNIIYVDCDDREEPFKGIGLTNQVTFDNGDERRLVDSIFRSIGKKPISNLKEWRRLKVSRYLSLQNENEEQIREMHYAFIADLAILYKNSSDVFDAEFKEQLSKVKLLNKAGKFVDSKTLTFSSSYHYHCDFEGHGVPEYNGTKGLNYISDTYLSNCHVNVNNLFNFVFNVHCNFDKNDIQYLTIRSFAIYFWSDYVHGSITQVKSFIEGHLLDDIACIPTQDYMKKPNELYSPDIDKYVTCVDDWKNKMPLKFKPAVYEKAKPATEGEKQEKDKDLFGLLNFRKSLSFEDSLTALPNIKGQDRRTQIGKWLIESYDSSCDKLIERYREEESSVWKNVNDKYKHITDLYALDSVDKLYDFFGTNPHIINSNYLPAGDLYKKLCDILKIDIIRESDIKMNHGLDYIETPERERRDLYLYALTIAGKEGADSWKNRYDAYSQKIDRMRLFRCKSISMEYSKNSEINQKFKQFYHADGSYNFYYVDSLNDSLVYLYFVKEFVSFLGAKITEDLVNFIMRRRNNALAIVRDDIGLMQNEDFVNEMNVLIPGFKQEKMAHVEDEDELTGDTRGEIYLRDNTPNENVTINEPRNSSLENTGEKEAEGYQPQSSVEAQTEITLNNPSVSTPTGTKSDESVDSKEIHDEKANDVLRENKEEPAIRDSVRKENQSYGSPHETRTNGGPISKSRRDGAPRPYSTVDVERLKSHGVSRCLSEGNGEQIEIEHINTILGVNMDEKEIADNNYLVRSRLYQVLTKRELKPDQGETDFVRNSRHTIGGKYIQACSAAYGIFYISPSIWNKVANGECIVCVYLGKRSKDFILIESIEDILKWVHEDDIVIKLTGKEKPKVVKTLYSGVLNGVTATAYTMVRVASNSAYNPVFASMTEDSNQQDSLDEL